MGLDIYIQKRPRVDGNAELREKKSKELQEIDETLNSRGQLYLEIYEKVSDIEFYSKQNDDRDKDRIAQLKEKVAELDKDGKIQKQIEEDKPLWDKYGKLTDEIDELNPTIELAYFRKVNFLVRFFNYEENCSNKEITKDDIEELIDRCKKVLENHDLAEELLPTQSGFFFGNYDYNEEYFEYVQMVLDEFTTILNTMDWDNYSLEIHCWW